MTEGFFKIGGAKEGQEILFLGDIFRVSFKASKLWHKQRDIIELLIQLFRYFFVQKNLFAANAFKTFFFFVGDNKEK
jgi:hypothetical protein